VLTEGSAGKWAICLRCDRRGGRGVGRGWSAVALWLVAPLLILALLLALLVWLFG
jgi:hypothetical protein